jgi:hypothetical protein
MDPRTLDAIGSKWMNRGKYNFSSPLVQTFEDDVKPSILAVQMIDKLQFIAGCMGKLRKMSSKFKCIRSVLMLQEKENKC